eukprot:9171010-Lingulodinium_polyedra.AAC.1
MPTTLMLMALPIWPHTALRVRCRGKLKLVRRTQLLPRLPCSLGCTGYPCAIRISEGASTRLWGSLQIMP